MTKKELELALEECNVYVNMDDYSTADRLIEAVQDEDMCSESVLYYTVAIEYLRKEDPSLRDSLEIAQGYGCDVGSLNSEILASLLTTRRNEERFYDLQDEIEEYYDELDDD